MEIEHIISQKIQTALETLGLAQQSKEIILTYPPQKELGHYSLPCFNYAKQLKLPPAKLAAQLQELCGAPAWLRKATTAGGFLNFYLNTEFLAHQTLPSIANADFFQLQADNPKTYMVEYSQPNTHKIFHVGHVRNVCLGDSICRLLRYSGHKVIAANYIGDEGTHVAKCLWQLERSGEQPPPNNRSEWLGKHYQQATLAFDKDKHQAELSAILHAIAAKKGTFYDLWQQTRSYCLQDFATVYRWLQTEFDVYYYESEVPAAEIIQDYKKAFTLSEGAYGVQLGKLGFFMVLKSDGNTLYATKDLALAQIKFNTYNPDHSLYVVGAEQKHYFQQVFKALEVMGLSDANKNHHISYGLVRLQSGKMSSRQGNIIPFSELQKQLYLELEPHLQKYRQQWSTEQIATTTQKLASGAIKYGMLQTDPVKEIIFDLKAWLQFEGNTGLYLIYAYARANSLLTKAGVDAPYFEHLHLLNQAAEEDLLLLMARFNSTAIQAAQKYKPSTLATLLYQQARAFSVFYAEHAILKADSAELRSARLALVYCFRSMMHKGLQLLGIDPPDQI